MTQGEALTANWFYKHLYPHHDKLKAWLRGKFPEERDLDDVIQEAYVNVLQVRQRQPIVSPKSFLFKAARNLTLNSRRRAQVRSENMVLDFDCSRLADHQANVIDQIAQQEKRALLTEAIESLPPRCREIFTLWRKDDMPPSEIAKKLNLSVKTVYNQIAIGLEKCAKHVGPYHQGVA